MNDRTPTKVLPNGAIRYGVYDEAGNFLRYEYIKLEDMPTQEGMPICKATLLSDSTAASLGLPATAVPDDALKKLAAMLVTWKIYDFELITGSYTADTSGASRQIELGRNCVFAIVMGNYNNYGMVLSIKSTYYATVNGGSPEWDASAGQCNSTGFKTGNQCNTYPNQYRYFALVKRV